MTSVSQSFTVDPRRLRVLRDLQAHGTIGATAAVLHLTPSAISQQIAALSREAGVPLLARHGRGVRLTPQARLLLEHADAVASQLERARADLAAYRQGQVGQLAIGALATAITAIVAPAVASLRAQRPRLRLSVTETEAPACFHQLDGGDLDLAISVAYPGGPHHGDHRYVRRDLLADPFQVALPPGHPLAGEATVELAALAAECWILGAPGGPCGQAALAICAATGFGPDVRHRAGDWAAVLALVRARCGVALIPGLALPASRPAGVVIRPVSAPIRPARHIYAAVRAGAEHSPGLAAVLAALQAQAATLPPGAGPAILPAGSAEVGA